MLLSSLLPPECLVEFINFLIWTTILLVVGIKSHLHMRFVVHFHRWWLSFDLANVSSTENKASEMANGIPRIVVGTYKWLNNTQRMPLKAKQGQTHIQLWKVSFSVLVMWLLLLHGIVAIKFHLKWQWLYLNRPLKSLKWQLLLYPPFGMAAVKRLLPPSS